MSRVRTAIALGLLLSSACGAKTPATAIAPAAPVLQNDKEAKCSIAKSHSEPLVVEWPSSARAKLESLSHKGVVVVAYQGCEMSVLGHCKAPGAYTFSPTTRKRDVVTIKDADELYANIPTGAAKLEGKLATYGQLNVSMTIVGRYESSKPFVSSAELEGDCAGATHVLVGLTTGAFKFFAGTGAEVGGKVDVMGAGAGGKSSTSNELLNEDGVESACANASTQANSPPADCGAILKVEVMPLNRTASSASPAGSSDVDPYTP